MMYKDYRLPGASTDFDNLQGKKKKLIEHLKRSGHPRAKDHYAIYKNEKALRKDFLKVYKLRCAYCGTPAKLIGVENLEIDHFVCKAISKEKDYSEFEFNHTNNLISACRSCNRRKLDLVIPEEYRNLLNPDMEYIKTVFYRDDYFKIRIATQYENDEFIDTFYRKLNLECFVYQLDFLISEIDELVNDKQLTGEVKGKLHEISNTLKQKRNTIFK